MKRIATALVLIPVAVWLILGAPWWAFAAALGVVGVLALREFDQISAAQGVSKAGLPGIAAGLAVLFAPDPLPMVVVVALVAMALTLRAGDLTKALPGAGVFLLGVLYIFGSWRCALELREINRHWMMIAALVCWVGDTAALYVGKAFGRHKLAPVVSPQKTWEGFFGSVIGAVAAAGIYAHYLIPETPLVAVLLVAAVANVAGQAGDLCESAFKRGAGLKDSGAMLPGHGGVLDRIDAMLFSVPVVYVACLYYINHVHF